MLDFDCVLSDDNIRAQRTLDRAKASKGPITNTNICTSINPSTNNHKRNTIPPAPPTQNHPLRPVPIFDSPPPSPRIPKVAWFWWERWADQPDPNSPAQTHPIWQLALRPSPSPPSRAPLSRDDERAEPTTHAAGSTKGSTTARGKDVDGNREKSEMEKRTHHEGYGRRDGSEYGFEDRGGSRLWRRRKEEEEEEATQLLTG